MYYIYGLLKKNAIGNWPDRLFYIGQTNNLKIRMNSHKNSPHNTYLKYFINKYDFETKVIWTVKTKEECNEREIFLIRYFGKLCDKTGPLANLTAGGDFNIQSSKYTDEFIVKHLTAIKKSGLSLRGYCSKNHLDRRAISNHNKQKNIIHIKNKRSFDKDYINSILDEYKSLDISVAEFSKIKDIEYYTLKIWVRKAGLKNKSKVLSQEKIDNIINLFESGVAKREIHRRTKISRNAISDHINKHLAGSSK